MSFFYFIEHQASSNQYRGGALIASEHFSEAVVEPQIMFESKAQTDLKAEHTR